MTATVYTSRKDPLVLTKELGRGGEGTVYSSPVDRLECAKVYTKPLSVEARRKLELMIANPPSDPTYTTRQHRSITWPTALLYGDVNRSQCAGFLMPAIDVTTFRKAIYFTDPGDRMRLFGGSFTWKYLYMASLNVVSAVAAIHEKGYCIGDLNESNVLIAANALVAVIDCDSFQVPDPKSGKNHRCLVGKAEYTAPELQGRSYGDVDRTPASDCFALAVMLFQLMMEGTHPFQAKGSLVADAPTTQAKIVKGYFPYAMRDPRIAPPDHAPPFEILHPQIRVLFRRCFGEGHKEPNLRPTALDWFEALRGLAACFEECARNKNHLYLEHLTSCPWCELAEATGKDLFPSPVGEQVALAEPGDSLNSLEKRLEYLHTYVQMAFADGVLTAEEEAYLNALGAKLQIPRKEIDRAIQGEAAKAQGRAISTGTGAPQLEISKSHFEFVGLRGGATSQGGFLLSNGGGGTLQGSIRSNRPWLKVPKGQIDTTRHRQEISFDVETVGLALGLRQRGEIEVRSNGGTQIVAVDLSVEVPDTAIARFRTGLSWGGFVFGIVFGYLLYSFLPSGPSRDAITASAGLAAVVTAVVSASRKSGFAGGCWGLISTFIVLGLLGKLWPAALSALSWAIAIGAFFHLSARPLFIARQTGNTAKVRTIAGAMVSLAAVIIIGGALAPRFLAGFGPSARVPSGLPSPNGSATSALSGPPNPGRGPAATFIDEMDGTTTGSRHGITFERGVRGSAARFTRTAESRIQYPTGIPEEGTLEWWLNISDGYFYANFALTPHADHALLFATDSHGGDVTWPGAAKLFLWRDGKITFDMATAKGDRGPHQAVEAHTQFRFGEWHALGVSFGSKGQYIMLDGRLVASEPSHAQWLGRGGTHNAQNDIPTIGQAVSGHWARNQYDGGFEGLLNRFRASPVQRDWVLARESLQARRQPRPEGSPPTSLNFIDIDNKRNDRRLEGNPERMAGETAPIRASGHEHALVLHPLDQRTPAFIERTLSLSDASASVEFAVRGHPNGDCLARVIVKTPDGREVAVYEKPLVGKDGWHEESVSLEQYRNMTITVRLENHATGWSYEFMGVDHFYVLQGGTRLR